MTKKKPARAWVSKGNIGETDTVASPAVTAFLNARTVHALTNAFGQPVDKRYQKLYGRLTPPHCSEVVCFSDAELLAVKGVGKDGLERIKDLRHYLIHGELRRKVSTPSRAGKKLRAPLRPLPTPRVRVGGRVRDSEPAGDMQDDVVDGQAQTEVPDGNKQKAYRAKGRVPKASFGSSSTPTQDRK